MAKARSFVFATRVIYLVRTLDLIEMLIELWVHSPVVNRVFHEIDGGTSIRFYP